MKFLKFKMWKFSWILLSVFVLTGVLDFVSTFSVGDLVQYMETNPVYLHFGWFPVIALNFLALYLLLKAFDSKSIHNRFMVIASFVYLMTLRIAVIINNFKLGEQVQTGEITKEMVMTATDTMKTNHYVMMLMASLIAPIILSLVIFYLFTLDNRVEIDD